MGTISIYVIQNFLIQKLLNSYYGDIFNGPPFINIILRWYSTTQDTPKQDQPRLCCVITIVGSRIMLPLATKDAVLCKSELFKVQCFSASYFISVNQRFQRYVSYFISVNPRFQCCASFLSAIIQGSALCKNFHDLLVKTVLCKALV